MTLYPQQLTEAKLLAQTGDFKQSNISLAILFLKLLCFAALFQSLDQVCHIGPLGTNTFIKMRFSDVIPGKSQATRAAPVHPSCPCLAPANIQHLALLSSHFHKNHFVSTDKAMWNDFQKLLMDF